MDFTFTVVDSIPSGWSTFRMKNTGMMDHFFLLTKLPDTVTIDDYLRDFATYLANPDVAYSTASGDWREKIGNQFWLAMYNRGFEGWTVWRKYDAPQLNLPVLTERPVPTRYTYPVNEQNLNAANWMSASSEIGGDDQTTKIFWDMN